MASPTVSVGRSVIAVSCTRCRRLTQPITSATTSIGMSCGITVIAPRRAVVSAIRRPATAVMLEITSGMWVPVPSLVERSTSSREPTSERDGARKTSL